MAVHWVAPIFLSASPHLNVDTNDFGQLEGYFGVPQGPNFSGLFGLCFRINGRTSDDNAAYPTPR